MEDFEIEQTLAYKRGLSLARLEMRGEPRDGEAGPNGFCWNQIAAAAFLAAFAFSKRLLAGSGGRGFWLLCDSDMVSDLPERLFGIPAAFGTSPRLGERPAELSMFFDPKGASPEDVAEVIRFGAAKTAVTLSGCGRTFLADGRNRFPPEALAAALNMPWEAAEEAVRLAFPERDNLKSEEMQ